MLDTHQNGMGKPLNVMLVKTFEEQVQETFDVCFSPDGKKVLSSDGNAVYIGKLEIDGEWKWYKRIPCFAVAPHFAPDGKMFVYRDKEHTLHLSSLEGEELAILPYPKQTNVDSTFSPDQRWLVSGNTHGELIMWDLLRYQLHSASDQLTFHTSLNSAQWTPSFYQHLQERFSSPNRFRFTPDGQKLAFVAASDNGYVHIYHFDPLNQQFSRQKTIALTGIADQKIAPDGKMIAIIGQDDVYVYHMESFQLLANFVGTRDTSYTHLAFSPDSQFLAGSTLDGNIDIWSLQTFEKIISFEAHPGLIIHWSAAIGGLDWSVTDYIVTGGSSLFKHDPKKSDYSIKIWKVEK